jgi:hypothetical protein
LLVIIMLVRPSGIFGSRELSDVLRGRFGRPKPAAG